MEKINLNFSGPYTFTEGEMFVFKCEYTKSAGIYLWTIKQTAQNYHLIHYIGETVSFSKRQKEHLIHILGLNYGIFNPEKAQKGILELQWDGLWRNKTVDGPGLQLKAYKELNHIVLKYVSILNIFFAELNVEKELRKHIEGCIGYNLRNNHKEYKVLYPDDNHIGTTKAEKTQGELIISNSELIRGLDPCIKF